MHFNDIFKNRSLFYATNIFKCWNRKVIVIKANETKRNISGRGGIFPLFLHYPWCNRVSEDFLFCLRWQKLSTFLFNLSTPPASIARLFAELSKGCSQFCQCTSIWLGVFKSWMAYLRDWILQLDADSTFLEGQRFSFLWLLQIKLKVCLISLLLPLRRLPTHQATH